MNTKQIPKIEKSELSKVENNMLNAKQLALIMQKTPKKYTYKRQGKGGYTWTYVKGSYVRKILNLMFGWDWDFEIINFKYDFDIKQCIVQGKLTCRCEGKTIIKMQFGRKDIAFKRGTDIPLDLGNDLKAAATDALKKCASDIGIASDIYAPQEYKEIEVIEKKEYKI